jgi:Tfp pilus assembly protein PilZ
MYSEILTEGDVLFRTKDATESGNSVLLVLSQQNTPEWL